jgi:hypothetical protein
MPGTNGSVTLTWQTASEQNNKGFDIERMVTVNNISTWQEIGFVAGAGNATIPTNYTFEDHLDIPGKYNYRLKQVDLDNAYMYSAVKTIDYNTARAATITVFPNPVTEKTMIAVSLNEKADMIIHIADAAGKFIKSITRSLPAGDYQEPLYAAGYLKGIYFCQVSVVMAGSKKIVNKTIKLIVH